MLNDEQLAAIRLDAESDDWPDSAADARTLLAEVDRLRGGVDLTERNAYTWPTPGQLLAALADASEAQRVELAARLIESAQRAAWCASGHLWLQEETAAQAQTINALMGQGGS